MNRGWPSTTLAQVCEFKPSKAEARQRLLPDALVSFAPMENLGIDNKYLRATEQRPLAVVSGSYTYFADGDVLLAKITPCFENGKLGIARNLSNGVGFGSSEFFVIRPSAALDPEFLYYFLSRPEFRAEGATRMGGAVGQQRVPREFIEALRIPAPPVTEQKRIVRVLDEAFEALAVAKANAEKTLQNARAVFKSHIEGVFGSHGGDWISRTLGEIAEIKGGKRVPKGYTLLSEPTGFPYLRVSEFNDSGTIDMGDLRYVSPEVHRQIKRYVIYSTDLYISIAGTIGKTGIIPEDLNGSNLTENACRLVFHPGVDNRFVYFFTLTEHFVGHAGLNTRTAAQPKLALSRLATITIPIPPLSEQRRLVASFDKLRDQATRLESIYRQKLTALNKLKKSLLHQAFTGKL